MRHVSGLAGGNSPVLLSAAKLAPVELQGLDHMDCALPPGDMALGLQAYGSRLAADGHSVHTQQCLDQVGGPH